MSSEEKPVLNDNLTDAMARIAFYHKNHHGKLSYNENVFFADLDTIITFAEHLLKTGEYEKVITLLTVLNEFIERKLNRDKKYSEQMGAFLSARFFHTYGMALHRQNRYHEAYYYLLSAETIYTLNSPIGYKLYEMITQYPY